MEITAKVIAKLSLEIVDFGYTVNNKYYEA